jgi:DNA repair protein SbcD/Mre11
MDQPTMTYKILHLSDLHLDHPFTDSRCGPAATNARRAGLRHCLQRAIELARFQKADALTIGGDLFEAAFVSPDTAEFLRQQLSAAAPIRIFIAPGDQDSYSDDSLYNYVDWPANVHIFHEPRLTPVVLRDDLLLWGIGCESAAFAHSGLTDFRVPEVRAELEIAHVLLLHGLLQDPTLPENKRSGITFSLEEVRRAGFNLALLGGPHSQLLLAEQHPIVCYPGSPEPLAFDEVNAHSIVLAEWDDKSWEIEHADISQWQVRTWQLDAAAYGSQEQLIAAIRELHAADDANRPTVARVLLTGQPASGLTYDPEEIARALAGDLPGLQVDDQTTGALDLDTFKTELTIRGSFVRRGLHQLEAARHADDAGAQTLAGLALRHGLRALEGRKVTL